MVRVSARAALLSLALVALASPLRAQEAPDSEKEPPKWDVNDPGGPYRDLAFETTESTWSSVDVHPDGTRLVFDLLGDLYTLPIAGGEATPLTSGMSWDVQPRWSPDGASVLFTSDRGGGDNLWVIGADGADARAVTSERFRLVNNGAWHPSGRFVVGRKHFTSRRSLGAGEMWTWPVPGVGAEASEGVQLTKRRNDQQDAGEPVFSPDGRYLWWSEDMSGGDTFEYNKDPHGTIYVIRRKDLETGEVRDVLRRPGGAVRPQPSPDGRMLAFVRRAGNDTVLALLDIESGAVRDLWRGLSHDQQETWAIFGPYPGFSWTPDGRSLVVWAKGHVHRVDATSGEAQEIPFRASVTRRISETVRIQHSLASDTFPVKVVRWPQVTPDGRTAVFQALGHLYRKDLASGAVSRITSQTEAFEFAPELSRDGARVVYVTWSDAEGGQVRIVGVDGSNERTLVARPGHYLSASLSPDGKDVVCHRGGADRYRGAQWSEDAGIFRKRVDEPGELRLVTREGRRPRFSADGRRVLLLSREGERNALVSVDRIGSDRRVRVTSEHARDFAISPDERHLAFEELWQTYVAPMPPGPGPFEIGPKAKALPVRRLSRDAGTYLSWSRDGESVRWSLGPDLFEARAAEVLAAPKPKEEPKDAPRGVGAAPVRLGFDARADIPATDVWLVGGTVLPMHDLSVIDDGVVHVRGNRIVAVGTRTEVPVPEGARVLDVRGKTVMPGLVDVHAHTGSSDGGVLPQRNWAFLAALAFGVTTSHDPSNDTQGIYAESELVRAGLRVGPRILSTGTILYGAEGDFKAVIDSLDDAREAIRRTSAWGPVSVKSYNQPRRDQRQQVIRAARELGVMVMPEGGSTLHHNLTQIVDGHTTIEHALPVAPLHEPELRLFAESGTSYTPTLVVGYGGLFGENWWYGKSRVWEHERLLRWVPRGVVEPAARRRVVATDDADYNHVRLASTAAELHRRGVNVEIGAHGQLQGLGAHWETWMLEQGGLSAHEALRCATWGGARALCLDHELGAIRAGYLADLIVIDGAPHRNVRDSEKVLYTMVNGRLYDAATLDQLLPERVALPPGPPLEGAADHSHADCLCR